jgi:hypothetical protein
MKRSIIVAAWARYELSSLAQTLRSRVRIPFRVWMSVCVYSVFVFFLCVDSGLATADPPFKSPADCVQD